MNNDRFPPEMDALFASYRNSFAELDASRNFMPGLWSKIEQRQSVTYGFRRMARGFVTVAAAICLMMSAVLWSPPQFNSPASPSTYVDVLADGANPEFELAELR